MASSRNQSRFEMLISVGVGGLEKFKKLDSLTKKTAKSSALLGDALKATGTNAADAKQRYRDLRKSISDYSKEEKILIAQGQKLARLNRSKAKDDDKRKAKMEALKGEIIAQKKAMAGLAKEINNTVPGFIKLDKTVVKHVGQQKKLKNTMFQLKTAVTKVNQVTRKSTARIKKNTAETKKNAAAHSKSAKEVKINAHAFNALSQRITNAETGFAGLRRRLGAIRNQLLVLAFATRALRDALGGAFQATKEMEAALKGLGSVATNTGQGFTAAKDAATGMAEEGLITVKEAAAGLKNLLSAGFGLAEATQLMKTLTDAAAFNRQGTLALGEAVVGATQGIKNQNSIMVDNAGITKNLSVMYKEYAATLGTTMGKLTEAEKKQAIFAGILKEGAIFAGDAAKAMDTLQGQLAKLAVNSFNAKAALGDALRPAITTLIRAFAGVSESIKEFLAVEENAVAISKGFKDAVDALLEVFKVVGGAIKLVTGIVTGFTNSFGVSGGGLTAALLRTIITLKIFHGMQAKSAKAIAATSKHMHEWVAASHLAGKKTGMLNTQTGELITGWKALKLHVQMARVKVSELNATMGTSNMMATKWWGSMGKIDRFFIRFVPTLKAATMGVRSFTVAMGTATKAAKLLLAPFVKIMILMAALEIVVKLVAKAYDVFSGAASDRLTAALARQHNAFKALRRGYAQTAQKFRGTKTQAMGLGIDANQLTIELKSLKDHHTESHRLHTEFLNARNEKDQEAAKKNIDIHNALWDEKLSKTIQAQAAIEQKIAAFNKTRMDLQAQYQDMIEDQAKKAGVKDLVDIEDSLRALNRLEKDFNAQREQAGAQFEKHAETMQKQFTARRVHLESLLFTQKEKIMVVAENKIQAMRDTINNRWIKGEESTLERIAATNESARLMQETKIKLMASTARTNLDLWVAAYRSKALEAKSAFEGITAGIGTGGSAGVTAMENVDLSQEQATGLGGGKKGGVKTGMLMGGKIAQWLKEDTAAFNEQKIGIEQFTIRLENLTDEMRVAERQVKGLGVKQGAYTNALALVKGELESTKTKMVESTQATARQKEVESEATSQKLELAQGVKELTDLNDEGAASLTSLQQKQWLYNEAVRQAAVDMQRAAQTQQMWGIIMAGSAAIMEKGAQHKFAMDMKSTKANLLSIVPVYGDYLEKQRQHTEELRKLKAAQEEEKRLRTEKMDILKAQIEIQKKMMEVGLGADGVAMTKEQVEKESEKLAVMEGQLRVLETEHSVFSAIANLDFSNMEALLNKDAMKVYTEAMANMTVKGLEFATGLADINYKTTADRKKFNKEQKALLDKGEIDITQYHQLTTESEKYYSAKADLEQTKMTANLLREIGKQVMLYAAKKAAASGNILVAMGLLTLGGAAMLAIENQARQMEGRAQREFDTAEADFQRRQDEIMGVDEGGDTGEATRKFGGTIKAQSLQVSISPTVVIQGDTIFIGQGSVAEFGAELQALILDSTNEAIETGQVSLNAAPAGMG